MGKNDLNNSFIEDSNINNKLNVFRDKLKRHLSNEFLVLSDRKDDLENEVIQAKIEKDQKDKTLFQTIEKKDVRKYFSPLNIKEIEKEQKDEKQKSISMHIERLENSINQIDSRMEEIKSFLQEMEVLFKKEEDSTKNSDSNRVANDISISEHEKVSILEDISIMQNTISSFMSENLGKMTEIIQRKENGIDVLIEFDDNHEKTDKSINYSIIKQIYYNIMSAIMDCDVTMVLIEGSVDTEYINIMISYMCDHDLIDTMNISYSIQRM